MGRVPGSYRRGPDDWAIVKNPGYPETPRIMVAQCHDGSPFLTVRCTCGEAMHFHESQLLAIPTGAEIESRCRSCGNPMVFPSFHFEAAFAQMRAEGWIE